MAALIASFLPQIGTGFLAFTAVAIAFASTKSHTIVVYENSLIEKDDRKRFIRKVTTEQIHYIRKNFLGEIILYDFDDQRLMCIEPNMDQFDRFEQWLAVHNIESK
jgi:hypothetical protein